MFNFNYASKTATSTATATSATATASALDGKQFQVVAFSGSSSDQPFKLELKFGTTVVLTLRGAADNSVGHFFNDGGPIGASNQAISCVITPDASGTVDANLVYRIVN